MEYLTAHPALLVAVVLLGGILALRIVAKLACLATLILIGLVLAGTGAGILKGII